MRQFPGSLVVLGDAVCSSSSVDGQKYGKY